MLLFLIQTACHHNQADNQRSAAENRRYRMRGFLVRLNLEIAKGGNILGLIRGEHWLSQRKEAKQANNRTNHYYRFHSISMPSNR